MTPKDWRALAKIADAKFQKDAETLRKIAEREGAVADRRTRLEAMNQKALADLQGYHPMQSLSGDVLWQSWYGKQLRGLGIEEARLRAMRQMHLPQVRKSFGRKSVMETLAKSTGET